MRAALHRARGEVISAFSRATTGQGGAAAAALATGASRVMAPVQRDRLARLGLLHLWAVSGLHLALVGGALLWILQRLQARLLPTRGRPAPGVLASLLALPFVAAYGVFAGAGPSVVRAGLAFGAYALLRLARRPARPATLLLAVVAVELGLATLELSSVGSLLSHSATAGILWAFCGRGERRTLGARRLLLPFRAALRAGVAASLATAAVQVAFFGSVAPFGIPAGALLVPLVGVVLLPLCLGAAATVLTGLAEIWDGPLALAAGAMDLVMGVLERVDRPGLRLTADPDLAPAVAAAAAVALWVWLKPRATGAVPARRRALLGAGALGALVLVPGMLPWGEAGATLLALDVGRGDAFLVRSATGSVALVDTGPGEPNGARSRVSPERLRRLGVSRVDLLVLTHRHADHAGGAHRLLRDLPVRRCVRPPTPRDSGINRRTRRFRKETPRVGEFRSETPGPPTPDAEEASLGGWAQLEEVLERVDLSCEAVQRGEILREGPFELRVLWPGPDAGGLMEENARSLMGRLSTGSGTIWISGDAGVAQEKLATAAVGEAERGGVLLVPHHGSSGSSSRSLLDNLAPVAAVASHGRPISRRVLARYRARGLPLCGTLAGGGARLELRGGRVLVPMACASVMMGFNPTERKKRRRLVLK